MTLRRRRTAANAFAIFAIGTVSDCLSAKEANVLKAEVENLRQDVSAVKIEVERTIDTGGGDVNDPVTGWILAAGYALVPVSFLAYLGAHRFRIFRSVKDRIRGMPEA